MYKNVMVAVDGSPSSKRALDEALKVAASCGARLFAVFAVDKSILLAYGGRIDPDALLDDVRRDGTAVLHDAERAISHAAVNGDTELIETELGQDVAERLQRYVAEHAIDLAVIGTHGRRGVRRLFLGSVAERFLRGSSCPVLLLRSDDPAPAKAVA
ncbi:TPA: universal stress protein [Burkholderia vietnamiensis]|uniref:universal stress protein n=1 Tax=Burkholderia vietnamiensis TaxID=60552 RepID=UPI0019FF6D4E|nr:universal stress protein [Burkholderia vietnamiensis]MBE0630723.1 universal stress protein [Burkholderia vietnamiensis]MCO1351354.1 universal stress protein [Burkholderia vietnamiensis]MCO1433442.1 universal stress protein [Burkholderia vietnamiensis]UQN48944.1 universal stress protein [Burkholderia vietnamiensis]HDR9021171.1 universal stress protein [Burkholderia vietnamiensis]